MSRRFIPLGLLALTLGLVATLAWKATHDEEMSFLRGSGDAQWVVPNTPFQPAARSAAGLECDFRRSFQVERTSSPATLEIRSLGQAKVHLNGQLLGESDDGRRQSLSIQVASLLRTGANELHVELLHEEGPPALWLELDGIVQSDGEWECSWAGSTWRPVRIASKALPSGLPSLEGIGASTWLRILLALAISAGLLALIRRLLRSDSTDRSLLALLGLAIVVWTALFLHNAPVLRSDLGFDASGHLDYIARVQSGGTLPLADEGWQMYQPPLYYLLAGSFLNLFGREATLGGVTALRMLHLLLAVIQLVLLAASMRLIFPRDAFRQGIGFAFGAFLPAGLYLFHYPTNETLAIVLSSATIYASLRMLRSESPALRNAVLAGICLGAALLTKFSALLLAPFVLFAVGYPTLMHDRGVARAALYELTAVAACLAVCGWHYARVWSHFGTPIVGNWDAVVGFSWWQDPGVRTAADYLRFGASLTRPWFSGVGSIADGLYSTLFADALFGGRLDAASRPPWNYQMMVATLMVGVPVILGLGAGIVEQAVRLWRKTEAMWAGLLLLVLLSAGAILYMTLRVPSYAQVKSHYVLIALIPLCAFVATGWGLLARTRLLRWGLAVTMGAWVGLSMASYWIDGDSTPARRSRAQGLLAAGQAEAAEELLRDVVAADVDDEASRTLLVESLLRRRADRTEIEPLLDTPWSAAGEPERFYLLARMHARATQWTEARAFCSRSLSLRPDYTPARLLLGRLEMGSGDFDAATQTFQLALASDPFDATTHELLGSARARAGRPEEAIRQWHWALRIDPDATETHYNLGIALAELGRFDEAVEELRRAQEIQDSPQIQDTLNRVLAAQRARQQN